MVRYALIAATLALGLSACGQPSVVKRGVDTPPPGETQLSPRDAEMQWGDHDRNKER